MKKLRIMQLTTDAGGISGAERILLGLGSFADRTAVDVAFVTVRPPGPLTLALEQTGWPVFSLNVSGAADISRGVARLRRLLHEQQPDVLHTHLTHAAIFGAVATLASRQCLVQTRHYTDAVVRFTGPVHQRVDRWAARRCRAIAAVSQAAADHLIAAERVPRSRVTVISNGVDWEGLSRRTPDVGWGLLQQVASVERPLIVCAATFHPRKGHAILIDAFAEVARAVPTSHLVLLGRGPDEHLTRQRVVGHGLSQRVHFLGHRDDAYDIIATGDLYVQPSVEEGFGLAVLEAMAMARPVVVSNVGGMCETVSADVGTRVAPSEAAPLAGAITRLLRDAPLRQQLGRAGSERVRTKYSMRTMVRQYERWYRTLRWD